MALIVVTVDTDNKTCSATIDGNEVGDVRYVCVSKYENSVDISIDEKPIKGDNNVTTYKSYRSYYDSYAGKIKIEQKDNSDKIEQSIKKFLGK